MLNSKIKTFFTNLLISASIVTSLSLPSYGQKDSLFMAVEQKMTSIPDYSCDLEIIVDVEFIKIPKRTGSISYTKEKGMNYKLDGFAFLPKSSFQKQSMDMMNLPNTIIKLGTIDDSGFVAYKLIPNDIDSEVILAQFWINEKTALVEKTTFVLKELGNYTATFTYGDKTHEFPTQMEVNFDIKNQQLPAAITGDIEGELEKLDPDKNTKASIVLNYSNYQF